LPSAEGRHESQSRGQAKMLSAYQPEDFYHFNGCAIRFVPGKAARMPPSVARRWPVTDELDSACA
jgi:hypothetical protein